VITALSRGAALFSHEGRMRRVNMAPILVTAGVAFFGAVAAVGFVIGLSVRDAVEAELPLPADTLASLLSEAPIDFVGLNEPVVPGVSDPKLDAYEALSSAALRFGILELAPAELTRWVTGESAALRATFEADAVAAAVDFVPNGSPSRDTLTVPDKIIRAH